MAYLGKKPNNKFARPQTSGKMTFFNHGTPYSFNPYWLINLEDKRISLLDLHKQLVLSAKSPTCFILDNFGDKVDCTK